MPNTGNNEVAFHGNEQLPLYSFFILLKKNGFPVTPEQITDSNRVISQYAAAVRNEAELCDYISPLFARNEDEQKQFKELFEVHFGEKQLAGEVKKKASLFERITPHLKKHWWKYLTALAIMLILAWLAMWNSPKPTISLTAAAGNYKTGDIVKVSLRAVFKENNKAKDEGASRSERRSKLNAIYDWGDHSTPDTFSHHRYKAEGNYIVSAFVDIKSGHNKYKDTARTLITVCNHRDSISLVTSARSDSITIHTPLQVTARMSHKPTQIIWNRDGVDQKESGHIFITRFDTAGQHRINCTAVYDSINSPCTVQSGIDLLGYDPNRPPLSVSLKKDAGQNLAVAPAYRVNSFWFYLAAGLLLGSLFFYTGFRQLYRRLNEKPNLSKDRLQKKYNDLVASFSGKKPPFELPFQNKNYLPVPEPPMSELSRQMRRRINDETTYLDLPKTIKKSIASGGLYQPVNLPRTQQSEYLFLIDESQKNNQQVKLFEFLAEILNRQNVPIEKYYYRNSLNMCYNLSQPVGISFEKLSEKYARHVLVMFGKGYELLSPFYPVFNYDHLQILNRWQYKAVLTPVSFADWSNKEFQGLLPVIPIFPVDKEGLLLFIQSIFSEDQNIAAALYRQQRLFYEVEKTDFENIGELEDYCDKADWAVIGQGSARTNILFQWIAALAVYPKIRWEITLAIGKAILDKYGKTSELNYSNLLRIVRIKWMSEGQFPDYTRLELLKKLDKENEVVARETILSLLNEIPEKEVNAAHFAYEEKVIQRVINEINLYAYDPVKYARYKDSRSLFDQLWKEKKIQDSPAKVYFKKPGSWTTLFNMRGPHGEVTNVGVEEYLDPGNVEIISDKKFYRNAMTVSSIVLLVSFFGLLGLTGLNFIDRGNIRGLTHEVFKPQDIQFTYLNNSGDNAFDNAVLTIENSSKNIENKTPIRLRLAINDSAKHVSLESNTENIFDSAMIIDQLAYTISYDKKQVRSPERIVVTLHLSDQCSKDASQFERIIKNTDSTLEIRNQIEKNNSSPQITRCLNSISNGKDVPLSKTNAVIQNFSKNGINLQMNAQPGYAVRDNEIALHYEGGPAKPVVYIQYNNRQKLAQIRQLQACLTKGIFNVPGIEYQGNFTRNEIRYYDNSTKDSITLLQACLRRVYPGRVFYPVQVAVRHSDARAEVWVYDSTQIDAGLNNYQIGLANFNAGRYNDALKHFHDAIAHNFTRGIVYRYIGQCYTYLNRPDSACYYYRRAISAGDAVAENLYNKNCGRNNMNANGIASNVKLVVRVDTGFASKDPGERRITCSLVGDRNVLDNILEVRYALSSASLPNQAQKKIFYTSTNRSTGFGYDFLVRRGRSIVYYIIVAKDKSVSKELNQAFDSNSSAAPVRQSAN